MIIGVDLDNTLICYDAVFAEVAQLQGWAAKAVARDKPSVKAAILAAHGNTVWTELQGLVYGRHIGKAQAYPAALETLQALSTAGHRLHIISHKTHFPAVGEPVDLRMAAEDWLRKRGFFEVADSLTFCDTREAKVARICQAQCDVFIDDLPEVLSHPEMPPAVERVLFDPSGAHPGSVSTWSAIGEHLLAKVEGRA